MRKLYTTHQHTTSLTNALLNMRAQNVKAKSVVVHNFHLLPLFTFLVSDTSEDQSLW